MTRFNATIEGFRSLEKPRIPYDAIIVDLGHNCVKLALNNNVVAEMPIGKIRAIDTLTLSGLNGYLEMDIR